MRAVLKKHKPYAKPHELPYLTALISSAIMNIAAKPFMFSYWESLIEAKFNEIKYG